MSVSLFPQSYFDPDAHRHGATGLHKKFLEQEESTPYQVALRHDAAVPLTLDSVVQSIVPGPDIQWHPSYETYLSRISALANCNLKRPSTLPDGYPSQVDKPWVWSGSDLEEQKYILYLDENDVREIEQALSFFKDEAQRSNLGPADVSPQTFPLPRLRLTLQQVAHELHDGIGFSVIRGLEPRNYTAADNVLIYLGVTSYIAEKRGCQDSSGNMIIHIRDIGYAVPNSELRQSPYANNAQPFHNDVCDILAMYVQETAAEGGESHLASCAKIYNEIATKRPDVIHTLADPSWIFDKHRKPAFWNTRALLFNFGDKGPAFCFSRRPITGSPTSPRSAGVPPMTEVQAEAIDMVHFTAVKHSVSMLLQRGDIQLINNLACQHARSNFVDKPFQRRHIIRLWLRKEELAWETPQGLRKTWFEKYGDSERRKIAKWNIYPGAPRERVLFRSDSCS